MCNSVVLTFFFDILLIFTFSRRLHPPKKLQRKKQLQRKKRRQRRKRHLLKKLLLKRRQHLPKKRQLQQKKRQLQQKKQHQQRKKHQRRKHQRRKHQRRKHLQRKHPRKKHLRQNRLLHIIEMIFFVRLICSTVTRTIGTIRVDYLYWSTRKLLVRTNFLRLFPLVHCVLLFPSPTHIHSLRRSTFSTCFTTFTLSLFRRVACSIFIFGFHVFTATAIR